MSTRAQQHEKSLDRVRESRWQWKTKSVQVVIELVLLGSRALEGGTFDGEHDGRVVRGEEDVPAEAIGTLPA